jgi:hypothetical protein
MVNNATLINQTSGNAARLCMGLDPASDEFGNQIIKADRYFTEDQDGLDQIWNARTCWLNHPFHRAENACKFPCAKKTCIERGFHLEKDLPGNGAWIKKLVNAYAEFEANAPVDCVLQACCLTYALTSEKWFRPLLEYPHCLLYDRTAFIDENGNVMNQNTKGCCVTYLGSNLDLFAIAFSPFGKIRVNYP